MSRRFMCSDADRDAGTTTGDPATESFTELDHEDAAAAWAEAEFDNSAGEWRGDVRVQEIDGEGAPMGDARVFRIEIEWSPTFTPIPRKV